MSKTRYLMTTWMCAYCSYTQNFDPTDVTRMSKSFPTVPVGLCPACFLGKNRQGVQGENAMQIVTIDEHKSFVELNDENEVDNMEIDDIDEFGNSFSRKLTNSEKQEKIAFLKEKHAELRSKAEKILSKGNKI